MLQWLPAWGPCLAISTGLFIKTSWLSVVLPEREAVALQRWQEGSQFSTKQICIFFLAISLGLLRPSWCLVIMHICMFSNKTNTVYYPVGLANLFWRGSSKLTVIRTTMKLPFIPEYFQRQMWSHLSSSLSWTEIGTHSMNPRTQSALYQQSWPVTVVKWREEIFWAY